MMTLLMSYCPGSHDSFKSGQIFPTMATTSLMGVTTIRIIVSALPLIAVCFKTLLTTSLAVLQVKRTVFGMTRNGEFVDDLGLATAPHKGRSLADHLVDDKEVGLLSLIWNTAVMAADRSKSPVKSYVLG
jgi:hypothetical protein